MHKVNVNKEMKNYNKFVLLVLSGGDGFRCWIDIFLRKVLSVHIQWCS